MHGYMCMHCYILTQNICMYNRHTNVCVNIFKLRSVKRAENRSFMQVRKIKHEQ